MDSLIVKCKQYLTSMQINQKLIRETLATDTSAHGFVTAIIAKIEIIVSENDRLINELRNDINKHLLHDNDGARKPMNRIKGAHITNSVILDNCNHNDINDTNNDNESTIVSRLSSAETVDKTHANNNVVNSDAMERTDDNRRARVYGCSWPECDYETRIAANIGKHYRVHSGEKPYACDWPDCGKRYQQQSSLATHKRFHIGLKPFACDWIGCQYRTNNRCSLPAHRLVHTGTKRFACDWANCGQLLATVTALKSHKLTHTGERPFACHVCKQSFAKASNMRAHILSVHEGVKRVRNKKC